MLRKLFYVFVLFLVFLASFAVYAAMQPSDYHVERSTVIAGAPAEVFAQVNDFHKWENWSPWVKIDPNCKETFEGPASGQGAIFRWSGNSDVGKGSMTILESRPNEHVRIELAFLEPMEGTAVTNFTLKPEGDKTRVTWSMDGKNNFIGKAMCVIMNMDKCIGDQYDKGLANMKKLVEEGKK